MDSSNTIGVGGFQYTDEQLVGDGSFDPYVRPTEHKRDKKYSEVYVRPTSNSAGEHGQPYEFKLEGDPYKWTNLQNIIIAGEMRVVNTTTNKKIVSEETDDAFEDFSLVNNYKQAIWSKIVAKINGCEITDPSADPYPYKSYLETLLNYNDNYKERVLKSSGWVEDDVGKGRKRSSIEKIKGTGEDANKLVENEEYNSAFAARRRGICKGGWVEINTLMHSDIITSQIPLPPGYILEFKMTRMSDDFVIINGKDNSNKYAIELRNIHLKIGRVQQSDAQLQAYNAKKNSQLAQIPLTRNFIKTYPALMGQTDLSIHNLIVRDQLPETVMVFAVTQKAFNGSTTTNPFFFETLNVAACSLLINSVHEPAIPYNNIAKNNLRESVFHAFLENVGASARDSVCCSIDQDKYYGGYNIFGKSSLKINIINIIILVFQLLIGQTATEPKDSKWMKEFWVSTYN